MVTGKDIPPPCAVLRCFPRRVPYSSGSAVYLWETRQSRTAVPEKRSHYTLIVTMVGVWFRFYQLYKLVQFIVVTREIVTFHLLIIFPLSLLIYAPVYANVSAFVRAVKSYRKRWSLCTYSTQDSITSRVLYASRSSPMMAWNSVWIYFKTNLSHPHCVFSLGFRGRPS